MSDSFNDQGSATGCECSAPGLCPRHQVKKTPHWHQLCQTRPEYFQQWEEGRGPGQNLPANPAPDLRCVHRGPVVRREDCQSCGLRTVVADVHACDLHGLCTRHAHDLYQQPGGIRNVQHGRKLPVCILCEDLTPPAKEPQPITLRVGWAPGDNVVATAVPRELARQYPGRFAVTIRTHYPQIWEHNPHVVAVEEADNADDQHNGKRWINLDCQELLDQGNHRPRHYLEAMLHDLRLKLGLPSLDLQEFKGHVYLADDERESDPFEGLREGRRKSWRRFLPSSLFPDPSPLPIWLLNAGGKLDCTAKLWPVEHWQELVDRFRRRVQFVQVGAQDLDSGGHVHPPLNGVVDLRGCTDHQDLRRLVYHCDGVICGNTYLMHLAAAVPSRTGRLRPCIVLGGGRENPNWYHYPGQSVLHAVGRLDCCAQGGCWKDRVVPLGDGRPYDEPQRLCRQAVGTIARCMADITPAEVAETLERILRQDARCESPTTA